MIAYKVVEKKTRACSNWMLYKRRHPIDIPIGKLKFRNKNKDLLPTYLKGEIVKAKEGTPGIMCFKDITPATHFILRYPLEEIAEIIKVEGYNEIPDPRIINGCGHNPTLLDFSHIVKHPELIEDINDIMYGNSFFSEIVLSYPIEGTICFDKVKVLE